MHPNTTAAQKKTTDDMAPLRCTRRSGVKRSPGSDSAVMMAKNRCEF